MSPTLSWSAGSGATSYIVYFGTSSSPSEVTATTGTRYTPSTLSNGVTYYWRIVATNSGGSMASPVSSFTTVNAVSTTAPRTPATPVRVAGTVSPSPWTGCGNNFTLTYSDSSGYQKLVGASAMVGSTFNGMNSCWWYYNQATNQIVLASNNASTWSAMPVSPAGVISSQSLSNSQCTVYSAWASGSGTTLPITITVGFNSSFAGQKTVWLYAADTSGVTSGYQAEGSWDIVPQ